MVAVSAGSFENQHGFRSRDVYMPLTPMFHVHAWGYPASPPCCVPTILQMILASPATRNLDLSNWSVLIGGAPLSKGLARAAQALGIDILSAYGMSETCPGISVARPKDHMMDWEPDRRVDIITKTGLPLPLVELEVVDPEDKILPHDGKTAGEVVMRAPWLTEGYFKAPEKSQDLWRNGWLHSGDIGHIDAQGYLKITDRIKDVIKSGGEWISSLDLEDVMSQHEAVLESAAVATPDPKWGERPLMLVALRPDLQGKVGLDQLKQHMAAAAERGAPPKYAVPDKYVIVDEIPKNQCGQD
jgi:fatty-acyl-CoA synthase